MRCLLSTHQEIEALPHSSYSTPITYPPPSLAAEWHVDQASGDVTRHETGHEDNFTQCGDFFRNVLNTAEKERLTDNIAGNLSGTHLECNQMPRMQLQLFICFLSDNFHCYLDFLYLYSWSSHES